MVTSAAPSPCRGRPASSWHAQSGSSHSSGSRWPSLSLMTSIRSIVLATSLLGDVAAALREHGSAMLDEHCRYFRRPDCVHRRRSSRSAQSWHRGLPVRAMTVTCCDGRNSIGVRYPPERPRALRRLSNEVHRSGWSACAARDRLSCWTIGRGDADVWPHRSRSGLGCRGVTDAAWSGGALFGAVASMPPLHGGCRTGSVGRTWSVCGPACTWHPRPLAQAVPWPSC